MPEQSDVLWEWSVFWHSDQLQSCLPDTSASGDDSLQGRWRRFFEALPGGAEVLDLGTGNGGLATQAVAVSKTRAMPFSIHGVDLADIEPARFVASAKNLLTEVMFHARTSMEKLPFDDARFDAVASQYAIEYSNTHKSLPEALRVMKDGACFRFLVHADDGVLKERCRLQAAQADRILDSELFSATGGLLQRLVAAEANNTPQTLAAAEQAITAVKAVFDDLESHFEGDEDRSLVNNLFAAVRSLPGKRRTHGVDALIAMKDDIRRLLLAQSRRLKSMQNAALDDAAAAELVDRLRALGAQNVVLEAATTGHDAECVGYWLSGDKAAGSGASRYE